MISICFDRNTWWRLTTTTIDIATIFIFVDFFFDLFMSQRLWLSDTWVSNCAFVLSIINVKLITFKGVSFLFFNCLLSVRCTRRTFGLFFWFFKKTLQFRISQFQFLVFLEQRLDLVLEILLAIFRYRLLLDYRTFTTQMSHCW